MSWRDRIRQLTLAGGAFSLAACGSHTLPGPTDQPFDSGLPCGNANPDPCICGRPEINADNKAQCDAKHACEGDGGSWVPYFTTDATGTLVPPHCESDGGAGGDAAPSSDAGPDAG